MNADAAGIPLVQLAVDGGMTANNLLMQMLADALNVPVVRPRLSETVALGAAYAAGLGAGLWPDHRGLRRNRRWAATWLPAGDAPSREADYDNWRRAVELSIEWGDRGR